MKKLLLFLGITVAVSAITWALQEKKQPPKLYPVSFSLEEWQLKLNHLEYIKQVLRKSDLPSKEVALITDSAIAPFQNQIANQIQTLLAQEKATQEKKDTVKPKKN
jgi:hypothetical protein